MSQKKQVRAAIYARKSTEEGLEQDFNSLDAQREACEAFIHSQAGLGWKLIKDQFDDGGISGGTMERPALQRLLELIARSRVDVVVVYKIDRLTRSLMDFAKMVEIFDKHEVSFVSVTQQFNTTTSMGRLTLHVLLSFAQFEREVTAERIRDKIAASKKKGIYTGGYLPLGYEAKDKRLVINEEEAVAVRKIFELYREVRSVSALKQRLDQEGIVTKVRVSRSGKISGGKPFTPGNLYALLQNRIYLGEMTHNDKSYPGSHEAIINEDSWQAVQSTLEENRCRRTNSRGGSLAILKGLLFDAKGDPLTPTHSKKQGQRYHYYVSHRILKLADKDRDGWRLPAGEIEQAIIKVIAAALQNERKLSRIFQLGDLPIAKQRSATAELKELGNNLQEGNRSRRVDILHQIVERIDLSEDSLKITFKPTFGLGLIVGKCQSGEQTPIFQLVESIKYRHRGVEAKLIIGGIPITRKEPDVRLITLIRKAHGWFDRLTDGSVNSIEELAEQTQTRRNEISRFLPLVFLAPDIRDAILKGTQAEELTANKLRRLPIIPSDWNEQRRLLGFSV